jgi:hypothetical protein
LSHDEIYGSGVGVVIIYFLTLLDKDLRDLDHYIFTTTKFIFTISTTFAVITAFNIAQAMS